MKFTCKAHNSNKSLCCGQNVKQNKCIFCLRLKQSKVRSDVVVSMEECSTGVGRQQRNFKYASVEWHTGISEEHNWRRFDADNRWQSSARYTGAWPVKDWW